MIEGIKHIIFDLGGVLLNIDYKLTEKAFVAIGIRDFPQLYSQLKQTPLFDDIETGKISGVEFIAQLQQVAGVPLTDEQVVNAWNAMLLNFPLRRLQILQQLSLHYDLVLLSNTNEIHEAAFNKILQQEHGIPNIGVFFDKVYLSHKVGLRKPMPEIFQKVLDDTGFDAKATLFIDDSPQHIVGAETVGIKAIHLTSSMTIEKDIFKPKQ